MTFTSGQRVTAAALNGNTVQLLSTTTLSAPSASVVIPVPAGVSYNFLRVQWRAKSSTAVAAEQLYLQLNGDTGNDYLWQNDQANNATVAGTSSGGVVNKIQVATITAATSTANFFSSGSFEIGGASDATNFKTVVGTATAYATSTNSWAGVYAGQWSGGPVTTITLFPATNNLVTGCIFSLYGSD